LPEIFMPPTAQSIHGILTPHMVPLDAVGAINEAELRRYVDWLIEKGVHGLYPNGSTGEFTRFTVEERRRIIQIVCEQAAGRVPVLAGAAEANVRETLAACEAYRDYGARAVAIVAPFYYKLSPESVFAYYREIAQHTPIDVTLYNIPMFASPIDLPTICRLAEYDRGGAAPAARLRLHDWLGCGAGTNAAGRLPGGHPCHQLLSARTHPGGLRPDNGRAAR
jgi:dihydrodipicolinate synthase/N-acetylneuraminate lyase